MKYSAALAGVAVAVVTAAAATAAPMYGLNKSGGIYTVDPQTGSSALLFATPAVTGKTPNAFAYDSFGERFFYYTQEDRKLYRVDLTGEALVMTLPSGAYYNATFWNGSLYSVRENTRTLMQVDLTGVSPVVTNFALSGLPNLTFGDIAVDPTGRLYGSAGQGLFTVDLNALNLANRTGVGSLISATTPRMQLGFSGNTLYGIQTDTDVVFSLDVNTGQASVKSILQNRSLTIQDAAGTIPEPVAAIPLLVAGGAMMLARRRSPV